MSVLSTNLPSSNQQVNQHAVSDDNAEYIRITGVVQGVGFRPTVWRLAQHHQLRGTVCNDGQGVHIHACGTSFNLDAFALNLVAEAPPLARVARIERTPAPLLAVEASFKIIQSTAQHINTQVAFDAAACAECVKDSVDPFGRRFRYPFTNCTHCGPRLSIVEGIPYDRSSTTMREFSMCADCMAEYENPVDRRFHAQPIACYKCGPRAWLARADGAPIAVDTMTTLDDVDAVCTLLQRGEIVAIKGLGGFQLACDATNVTAVARLRQHKQRPNKPFALMARDMQIIRQHCHVSAEEEALLVSPAAPIVLLDSLAENTLTAIVAPNVRTLGFMLPNTPLHHLMLRRMNRPIVMTSGNLADEPQAIDNAEAMARLGHIAQFFLLHNRAIARRVDDSIVRVVAGKARVLRAARGYAPVAFNLPAGFENAPPILAMGSALKNTFCLLKNGQAVLSHHIGELSNAPTQADYQAAIGDYAKLFAHTPHIIAVDKHPDYPSSKLGQAMAEETSVEKLLAPVQHHHAHIAACMAENDVPLNTKQIIGVTLDGLGWGEDGTVWGGEFFLADYAEAKRMATFKPVAMLGGEKAMSEPWRNTYAHIMAEMAWPRFAMNYDDLALFKYLDAKPRDVLNSMLNTGLNSPLASSCGRLFDAVAAAANVCRDHAGYEGEAAILFEALVDEKTLNEEDDELAYPFTIPRLKDSNLPYIEPLGMWQALLGDLILKTPVSVIAARFHKGLAIVIARMVDKISRHESPDDPIKTVVLSGGVFQNKVLLTQVMIRLETQGFTVLSHANVPSNDGGIALGQATIAAARFLLQESD